MIIRVFLFFFVQFVISYIYFYQDGSFPECLYLYGRHPVGTEKICVEEKILHEMVVIDDGEGETD